MVILMPIPPLMQDAVQAGYDRIIKRESERTNKQKVWEVFSLEGKNLEVLIYTNEIETFHTLLEHAQMCTPGTALALTVFYMKEETFYISGWKKYIEKTGDRSILQEFFRRLQI